MRLDKFLADSSRLGSRGRAIWALERGKVFSMRQTCRRLMLRDGWRPAIVFGSGSIGRGVRDSARTPVKAGDGELRILYEDDAPDCGQQARRAC